MKEGPFRRRRLQDRQLRRGETARAEICVQRLHDVSATAVEGVFTGRLRRFLRDLRCEPIQLVQVEAILPEDCLARHVDDNGQIDVVHV